MSESIGIGNLLEATPRLAEILGVLFKHGFGHTVHGDHALPPPAEMRQAFEELGVVFLKFGQVLALRSDLLPDAYIVELDRLQDRLPPMAFIAARAIIEMELGAPLGDLFATFEDEPLAAATIAQVHAATLYDGSSVVVKVRRAGLEATITEDIAALSYVAAMAENVAPRLRTLDLVGLVRQFNDSLRHEMDLLAEARTIRRFRAMLLDDPGIWIPDAVMELTTGAVLTMDHSPGERLDVFVAAHPEAAEGLARRLGVLMLRTAFSEGLFHADPHRGNVFVLPDGRLCFHDFGMVGELEDRTREALTRLLEALVRNDSPEVTESYLELVTTTESLDRASLDTEIGTLLRTIHGRPPEELSIGDTLQSLMRIGSRHGLRNAGAFLLLTRAILITEAVMRELDPGVNIIELAGTELSRIAAQRLSPDHIAEEGQKVARELARFASEAPADARHALKRFAEGNLGRVDAPGVEDLARRISRDMQRLTGAVASGALVVGGSMLVHLEGWHGWLGLSVIAIGLAGTLLVASGALLKRKAR